MDEQTVENGNRKFCTDQLREAHTGYCVLKIGFSTIIN